MVAALVFTHVCVTALQRWPWRSAWMSAWTPWISSWTITSVRAWTSCGQGNGRILSRQSLKLLLLCEFLFVCFVVTCFSALSAVSGCEWNLCGVNCRVVCFQSAKDIRITLAGFSPPGYEVFAEADAQGLTDSTANKKAALQNKHCSQDWLGR